MEVVGEAERSGHAMAVSLARQAVTEELPHVHRNIRGLILAVILLGLAVAAWSVYVVVGP